MTDLFSTAPRQPLAEALRPRTLDEVVGQRHLLGEGKPPGSAGETIAYICRDRTCSPPIADPERLATQLTAR